MGRGSRSLSARAFTAGLGSTPGLELERGADVNGLAIAPHVLERGHAVALDIVADATGDRDAPRDVVRTADIERDVVALTESRHRVTVGLVGAYCDSRGQAIAERIADTHDRALASAKCAVCVLALRYVPRDREPFPANRDTKVVAGRIERSDGGRGDGGARQLGLIRRCDRPCANRHANL